MTNPKFSDNPEVTLTPDSVITQVAAEATRSFIPALLSIGAKDFTLTYDSTADTAYISLDKSEVTESVLTEDNVILRYRESKLIGLTVINASKTTLQHN